MMVSESVHPVVDHVDIDWDSLLMLAEESGLPREQIILLRRSVKNSDLPLSKLSIVVGRQGREFERFATNWFGEQTAKVLNTSGVMLVGSNFRDICQALGSLPTSESPDEPYPLLVVAAGDATTFPDDLFRRLAARGGAGQAVIAVSSLQPFHSTERELAAHLSKICATSRCLMITPVGHEIDETEKLELQAFSQVCLRNTGFHGQRTLETIFVSARRDLHPCGGHNTHLSAAVSPEDTDVSFGHAERLRCELARIVRQGFDKAKSMSSPVTPLVSSEDKERLTEQLSRFLLTFSQELKTQQYSDNESLRAWARDRLTQWTLPENHEGIWLHHLERLRKGSHQSFRSQISSGIAKLQLAPSQNNKVTDGEPVTTIDSFILFLKRVTASLVGGVVVGGLSSSFMNTLGVAVATAGATLVSYIYLPVLIDSPSTPSIAPTTQKADTCVLGFAEFSNQLTAWLSDVLAERSPLTQRWRAMAVRWGVESSIPESSSSETSRKNEK